MDGERRGEIRVTQVRAQGKGAAAQVVTRIHLPGKRSHSRVPRTARQDEGVRITIDPAKIGVAFEIWVVVGDSDRGRADLLLFVPPEAEVAQRAVPVTQSSH